MDCQETVAPTLPGCLCSAGGALGRADAQGSNRLESKLVSDVAADSRARSTASNETAGKADSRPVGREPLVGS